MLFVLWRVFNVREALLLAMLFFPFVAYAGIVATVNTSEIPSIVTINASASSPEQCQGNVPPRQQIGWSHWSGPYRYITVCETFGQNVFPLATYPTVAAVAKTSVHPSLTYTIHPAGSGVGACDEIWTKGAYSTTITSVFKNYPSCVAPNNKTIQLDIFLDGGLIRSEKRLFGTTSISVSHPIQKSTLNVGIHTVEAVAIDHVGNQASATAQFVIVEPTPIVSIILGKPSVTACEAETGAITVTSNDPTPNGGTVTLSFPNGTTASAVFADKSANLTFADFALLNGYSGAHKVGDVLTFTASVTTAAGHTASSTAKANVIAGGLTVTVTPAKAIVEPKLRPRADVKPNQPQVAYTTPIEIYVTDMFQQPVSGASVSLQVETVNPAFGGHNHGNWLPPKLIVSKPTGTLSPTSGGTLTGFMNTTYTASEFSSLERIKATVAYQGCSVATISSNIAGQISGLNNLVVNSPHFKIGGTDAHHGNNWNGFPTTPDNNHWVSASTAVSMGLIMSDYATRFNGVGLYINDASLPKGGLFDANGDWTMPHQTHRRGIDIDVHITDTGGIADLVKAKLDFLNDKAGGKLFLKAVRESSPKHVHIQFYPN